jgi:hypothetical protein
MGNRNYVGAGRRSRWPSVSYLVHRGSREATRRAREELLAHCRSCGCIVCQVRLAMMDEIPDPVPAVEEKSELKQFLN